jgi:hypothetical protein
MVIMSPKTFTPQQDPPEGSREVIDRELARNAGKQAAGKSGGAPASSVSERPGDQAPQGTPGTGENLCPNCDGSGKVNGRPCDDCGGTGKITAGIGGA